ncbi:MAG TPA: nicotinamide-nucleotide amidohydrolase family protein [Gaiellaceae bacterium]|nr:nicotinamide-nucleotide amidohydrolase family protein [Gaiellaceae bacterium]
MAERPRAIIVVTGSELVRGGRRDANGPFLSEELTSRGLEPARVVIVGDRPEELEAAVREGLQAELCILSGGLGPTHDDRTIEMLARGAGRALVLDTELEQEIETVSRRVATRLRRPFGDFAAGISKQAKLPEGAISLGLAGTAPAVLLEHEQGVAVALPGPPAELQRLWPAALASAPVQAILDRVRPAEHRILRFFGPSESAVARALDEMGGERAGVEATVCARDLEIHVDLFVDEPGSAQAAALEAELRSRFAEALFAEDDERPVEAMVLDQCRQAGLTLATAESCTGGLVSARLTAIPGASEVFVGGLVSYSNDAKRRLLGVPGDILSEYGAVSAETAAAMAAGAREALDADVALAVTGVAGPDGGTPGKPVGLVFLHVQGPVREASLRLELPGDREAVQARSAASVLHLLRRVLTQADTHTRALAD